MIFTLVTMRSRRPVAVNDCGVENWRYLNLHEDCNGRAISCSLTHPAVRHSRSFAAGASGAVKEEKQSQVQLFGALAVGAAGAYYLFGDGFRSHRSEVSSRDPGSGAAMREIVAPSEGQVTHAPNAEVAETPAVTAPK